ncbi:hypothetical protein P67b_00073 [Ruegeria phage Tedan]|nr:hypothetical protein P67b_00073 [Ruegeria phage Tedan]
MPLLWLYVFTTAVAMTAVIFYHWGKMPHKNQQLWGTTVLLMVVAEQMQNQIQYAGWEVPAHIAIAMIIFVVSLVVSEHLAPKPIYEDER